MEISVVLVQPERGLNIGFTARAMMNFGVTDLRIVRLRRRLLDTASRYASHASRIVEKAKSFNTITAATTDASLRIGTTAQTGRSARNVLRTPIIPTEFVKNISGREGLIALVFGREGSGLTNEELNECDVTMTVPTSPGYPTMNLSHAVAVLLYALTSKNMVQQVRLSTGRSFQLLVQQFDHLLSSTGMQNYQREQCVRAWRNVLGRSTVSMREASLVIGALRRITVASELR